MDEAAARPDWIEVKHVQRVKRAKGNTDLYFRKGDYREGPLSSPDGTQALKDEVDAILKRLEATSRAVAKPKTGTLAGALNDYNRSADFITLARSTQNGYQDYIDELTDDCGDVLLADITRSWIMELRDAWAVRGYRAANMRLQLLKNALAPIIADDTDNRIKGDPFRSVENVRRPHDTPEGHPIWEDFEVEAAISAAITRKHPGLARAIALGRYGGFRKGTIITVPMRARVVGYNEDGLPERRINWITEKRKVLADRREDERLTAVLDATPNRAYTLAYNADGMAWTSRALGHAFDRLMNSLARAGKVRADMDQDGELFCPLTIHGLKHSRGVELAQSNASDAGIMAQLDHATTRAAAIYRRQAQRRVMSDHAQDQVDNVRELRKARETARRNASET
ncbi:phage integrase [Asticcacaulis biprosthecium C19]|uniref:Phage integrase n=1 Tax=Asticcacaulis biprosthecium C19 TaxID=715226 RepID=F4QJ04_9CAUL|nr:site-specific integrase [Asticcacaulis biprosthecium]EGF93067.1 phage integrase [Asticcacaulis biprosthecium C19]